METKHGKNKIKIKNFLIFLTSSSFLYIFTHAARTLHYCTDGWDEEEKKVSVHNMCDCWKIEKETTRFPPQFHDTLIARIRRKHRE